MQHFPLYLLSQQRPPLHCPRLNLILSTRDAGPKIPGWSLAGVILIGAKKTAKPPLPPLPKKKKKKEIPKQWPEPRPLSELYRNQLPLRGGGNWSGWGHIQTVLIWPCVGACWCWSLRWRYSYFEAQTKPVSPHLYLSAQWESCAVAPSVLKNHWSRKWPCCWQLYVAPCHAQVGCKLLDFKESM